MFDINKIISDAIATAVDAHITAIRQEYANKIGALEMRISMLEKFPVQGVETAPAQPTAAQQPEATMEETLQSLDRMSAMAERIATLEKHTAVLDEHGDLLEYLDNQEWFWAKIRNFTDTAVEQAMEEHTETYDHDDFVTEDKLDDYMKSDDLHDDIRDIISGATISIRC